MDGRKFVAPDAVEWSPAPAALPAGAEVAVLYGDPGKDGQFAMRIKLPQGYSVPPHSHSKPKAVTVLTGSSSWVRARPQMPRRPSRWRRAASPCSSPGTAHFVSVDEETVIQIDSVGPWGIDYVNKADDPRTTQ